MPVDLFRVIMECLGSPVMRRQVCLVRLEQHKLACLDSLILKRSALVLVLMVKAMYVECLLAPMVCLLTLHRLVQMALL